MKLDRQIRRRTLQVALSAAVVATAWWAWPRSPVPQPAATSPSAKAVTAEAEAEADQATPASDPAPMSAATPAPEPKQVEPVPKVQAYTVVEGDTVEAIAAQFGLEPSTILWSNRLTESSLLQIDQELLIPATDGIIHAVTEGDSFWEIALSYEVDVEEIIRANPDTSPDALQPGEQLIIPGGTPPRRATMVASRSGSESPRRLPEVGPTPESAGPSGVTGDLVWPLSGLLTEYFGWRTHPVYGTANYHEGIDISIPPGTPIRAVASGRVVMAEWYGGYGLTVKVDHGNGLVSRYSHDSELLVSVGENVVAGQVIAYSGNTGVSTGPHLDFGLYRNGVPVDPLGLLP